MALNFSAFGKKLNLSIFKKEEPVLRAEIGEGVTLPPFLPTAKKQIQETIKRKVVKPTTLPDLNLFTGRLPDLIVQGFGKQQERKDIYKWYQKTQPERYKELSIKPEIFTQQGRNKLVSKGLMTSEESEIFSAIPEYTPVITGMNAVGAKDFIKIVNNASKYKTGKDFANALAKRFGTTVEKFDAGIKANFGMPNSVKLWEYATGRTTALTVPNVVKPILPKKPPVPFSKAPIITPAPKVSVKPIIESKIIKTSDNNNIPIKVLQVNATPLPKTSLDDLIPFAKKKGLTSSESDTFYGLVVKGEIFRNAQDFGGEKGLNIEKIKSAYTDFYNQAPKVPVPTQIPPVSPTKMPPVAITPEKGIIAPQEVKTVKKPIVTKQPISKELQPLAEEAKKYKSAEEFVNKESFNPMSKLEYHLSDNPNLIEGKSFLEQIKPTNIGERGFGGMEENIGKIFSTKNPQQWSEQLNYEGNKKPQYVYLVEVKNPTKPDIMDELPQQSISNPNEIKVIKKIGGQKVIDNPSLMEEVKQSHLTDIYNQAVKEVKPKPTELIVTKVKSIPKEISGYTNIISQDDPLKVISKEIQQVNGLRLSGKITTDEANKLISKAKTELVKIAKEKDIALIKTEGKKPRPAIRESGFYATKDIEIANVKDVYNATMSPHLMALKQDMTELGGKFGIIFSKMWKPTEIAIRNEKAFMSKNTNLIKALGKKYDIGTSEASLKYISDVIEGNIKAKPNEELYIKELRTFLDGLRDQANAVRLAMGKTEIGYIENYIPHIQKASLWNELLSNKATISDNLDFIIPNQAKNPFAFKRMMEEMPNAERNLYILLDRYIRAISKDIYLTPAIENIKAYNGVLKNRELVNASRYWDEYIRVGLIGKQHRLDSALNISYQGRKALQKWNNMVNLAFLTGKVSWNLATQPLSYIMNVPMEAGLLNSVKAIRKSFDKPLRQFVKENSNTLNIKSSDVRSVAIGEGRNVQNRIYKTKIDKWNDFISMLGAVEERELTLASYIAGLERAKQLGLKDKEALWFADLTAARTQSMYNKENRALILNSDITRTLLPFQSFSVEMFNHIKEISTGATGPMRLTYRQRFGKLFRLLVGLYLANLFSKTLTGNKKTTIGTFVPFFGAYVDMFFAKAAGKQYYGGRSPITVIQVLNDSIQGARDFINKGDIKRLRKVGLNFGLALGGIGGGGQINNIIDGIMANINEDVRNIEGDVMFETKDALSKVIAPIFGVWATKEGREYWLPKEKKLPTTLPKESKLPSLPNLPKLPNLK